MAMTTLDERLLVEAHNGGDADAFVSIVNEYSPSLYAHTMMRLGEPGRPKTLSRRPSCGRTGHARFDGEFHLRAWLHRILTNVCFDEGDRRRREVRTLDRMARSFDPAVPPADEVVDLDRAFAQREVASALASLPDAYREALELRYVEQLSFREVADVTGVSEENARARVHRGRAALRRLISGPYAFAALFIPALRKGERAAQAALSSGGPDPVTATSSVSALAQQAPTFTRIAVDSAGRCRRRPASSPVLSPRQRRRWQCPSRRLLPTTRSRPHRCRSSPRPARERRRTARRSAGHDGRHRFRVDPSGRPALTPPVDAATSDATATTDINQPIDQAPEQQTFSAPPVATAAAAAPHPTPRRPPSRVTRRRHKTRARQRRPSRPRRRAFTASGLAATAAGNSSSITGAASLGGATTAPGP